MDNKILIKKCETAIKCYNEIISTIRIIGYYLKQYQGKNLDMRVVNKINAQLEANGTQAHVSKDKGRGLDIYINSNTRGFYQTNSSGYNDYYYVDISDKYYVQLTADGKIDDNTARINDNIRWAEAEIKVLENGIIHLDDFIQRREQIRKLTNEYNTQVPYLIRKEFPL